MTSMNSSPSDTSPSSSSLPMLPNQLEPTIPTSTTTATKKNSNNCASSCVTPSTSSNSPGTYSASWNIGQKPPSSSPSIVTLFLSLILSVWNATWIVIHYILDKILKIATGMNEIERILAGATLTGLLLPPPPVPRSITDSSVIRSVELYITSNLKLSVLQQMIKMVRVSDEDTRRILFREFENRIGIRQRFHVLFLQVMREIQIAHLAQETLIELQQTAFDYTNEKHVEDLHRLWANLTGNKPIPPMSYSTPGRNGNTNAHENDESKWSDIGFQSDPSRDFRGAGILSLKNLLSFSEKHPHRCRDVFKSTQKSGSGLFLPFAVTGLNITMWLCDLLKKGQLNIFFYNNPNPPEETFNTIYAFVFLEFSRFWLLSRPSTLLQFGQVSQTFLDKIGSTLDDLTEPGHHSEWNMETSTGELLTEELNNWIEGEVQRHVSASNSKRSLPHRFATAV